MLVRSAERAPYSAPQTASASADMRVLVNVVSICRSRSGLAWASCSCRKWAGSILLGAVIALVSWIAVRGFPEDHAVAALTSGPHPERGAVVHHPGGRHSSTLADVKAITAGKSGTRSRQLSLVVRICGL